MKRDWIKKVKNNTVVNGIVRLGIGTVLAIAKVCIPVSYTHLTIVAGAPIAPLYRSECEALGIKWCLLPERKRCV